MNEDEENEEHKVGDSTTTPVEEVHQPSLTSREEPPPPIGPTLDKDQIILESLDIITSYLRNINDQKHYLASMGYMLNSMRDLLEASREHEVRLSTFLQNDDSLQTRWLLTYLGVLPTYGDYALVLRDVPDTVVVDQVPGPVKESLLKELVDDVVHHIYAGGWQVKAQRGLDLKLDAKMDSLREMSNVDAFPFSTWLEMLANEIKNEGMLEDKFFEVSSYCDFMNHSSTSGTGSCQSQTQDKS